MTDAIIRPFTPAGAVATRGVVGILVFGSVFDRTKLARILNFYVDKTTMVSLT